MLRPVQYFHKVIKHTLKGYKHHFRIPECQQLTAWSRAPGKLRDPQLFNKFSSFYGIQQFITCSQGPATGPQTETNSWPHAETLFL